MRSSSRSMALLPAPGSAGVAAQERRRPADGRRIPTIDLRADLRLLAAGERIEQRLHPGGIEILVEIVVDLHHRRVDAGAEAFDLDPGEQAVGRGLLDRQSVV